MKVVSKTFVVLLAGFLVAPVLSFASTDIGSSIRFEGKVNDDSIRSQSDNDSDANIDEDVNDDANDDNGGDRNDTGLLGGIKTRASFGGNACARLPDIGVKFDAVANAWVRGEGSSVGISDDKEDGDNHREAYWDGTIKNVREDWDGLRQKGYEKMLEAAKTDAQRAAVVKFQASVDAAITAKRVSLDAWVTANKSARNTWEQTHKANIAKAYTDFATAVRAAISRAQASCTAGIDSATVTATFKSDIDAARATLQAKLDTESKSNWSDKKQAEHAKIMADFTAAIKAATAELKASYDLAVQKK